MNKADIDRICGSVDLYEALQRPINTWRPFGSGSTRVGIKDLVNSVDNIIDDEFKEASLSHLSHKDVNYFFEFSILPTVLDPIRPDKLECFSYLWGDKIFKDIFTVKPGNTLSVYEKVIADNLEQHGISVFHHPNFLFDIGAGGTDPVTMTAVSGKGIRTISTKNAEEKAIMMPRSFSETIQRSKAYYSSPTFKNLHEVQESLHQEIVSRITDSDNTYFISFPIIGAHSSNQLPHNIVQHTPGTTPTQGIGSFFLYIESNNITPDLASKISRKLYVSICNLGRLYAVNYLFNLGLQLQENARREAIKSAISAIMSRNMSHNLGSHYMYYTKAYLEQLANSVNDIAPDIRGAAKVLGYVQARMDYLATVISNDKYPYGAVNFKSQIYDELTVDDFSHRHFREDKNKRTTNFLLTNLILSENFTRPDVRSDEDVSSNSNQLFLHVKLLKEDNHYVDFTGTWHSSKLKWFKERRRGKPTLPTMTSEEDIKNQLSSLNIALPGGSMSCHAVFNVIENFIRNSAKYLQNDINKEEGLVCTLAIAPNPDNSSLMDITIYDNKKNANKIVDISRDLTLYDLIIRKLESLVIIDDQDKISKDNKGFKEMLFSSIWMRAYTFGNDKTYADIVSEINNVSYGESKIELIERYGFSLVRVQETPDGGITINKRKVPVRGECNLGLTITLPIFKQCDTINLSGIKSKDVNNILNIMADIVEVDKEFFKSVYHHVFTRPLLKDIASGMSIYDKYHKVVADRFPDIDKYALSLEKAEDHYNSTPKEFQIFFKRHMSTAGNADPCDYKGYAYADTISGGNFTITLLDLFKKGYENGEYKSDDDRIFALKIKESALTRITVIDERLFNSTEKQDYPWLSLKNVRVLNYDDSLDESLKEDTRDDERDVSSIFIGNSFDDNQDRTHFLTIHLGLIEKILKNSKFANALINRELGDIAGSGTYNPLDPIRVRTFMKLLRMHYSEGVQRDIYIAIHSGRGNYSAELEGPLSKYPFISLSALENAFNNSKYQLSQLLYNTVYIGKGFANNI